MRLFVGLVSGLVGGRLTETTAVMMIIDNSLLGQISAVDRRGAQAGACVSHAVGQWCGIFRDLCCFAFRLVFSFLFCRHHHHIIIIIIVMVTATMIVTVGGSLEVTLLPLTFSEI
jgi:hypothetical protein